MRYIGDRRLALRHHSLKYATSSLNGMAYRNSPSDSSFLCGTSRTWMANAHAQADPRNGRRRDRHHAERRCPCDNREMVAAVQ